MPIYKVEGKKKDGLQKYQVKVNFTDSSGKHRQIMRTAYGAQAAKELEHELTLTVQQELKNSQQQNAMTIQSLYEEYITHIRYEIRATSLTKKKQVFKHHILPFLAQQSVTTLDIKVLQDWKTYIYQKNLKLQTMKNCYKEFRAMLNYGVKMKYLQQNPLLQAGNFRDAYPQKKSINFYTPEEFKIYKEYLLQKAVESGRYDFYVFFCLAYYTGARKGEIHALRWRNYNGIEISIEASITQKLKGEDVETPPKNSSSIRVVQLPKPMINILNEHMKRQRQCIKGWDNNGFICGYYQPLRDSSIDNENRQVAKMASLKHIRVHDFRHSHASVLINGNINPLEVAHRLGHSTVEQTLKTYSHLFPTEAEKSLNILNDI